MNLLQRTCSEFGITERELIGKKRLRSYAYPRFALAVILRDFCGLGFSEIAHVLKRKDHSTIMHAVKTGRILVNKHPEFKEKLYTIAIESGIKPKRVVLKGIKSFYNVGCHDKAKTNYQTQANENQRQA